MTASLTCVSARDPTANNDRLEYLGDAVLKLIAHVYVFLRERYVRYHSAVRQDSASRSLDVVKFQPRYTSTVRGAQVHTRHVTVLHLYCAFLHARHVVSRHSRVVPVMRNALALI